MISLYHAALSTEEISEFRHPAQSGLYVCPSVLPPDECDSAINSLFWLRRNSVTFQYDMCTRCKWQSYRIINFNTLGIIRNPDFILRTHHSVILSYFRLQGKRLWWARWRNLICHWTPPRRWKHKNIPKHYGFSVIPRRLTMTKMTAESYKSIPGVTPFGLVDIYRSFEGTYVIQLQGSGLRQKVSPKR